MDNVQAMRDHLATEVMGWEYEKHGYFHKGKFQMRVKNWTPDLDANQRDMVMDTFKAQGYAIHVEGDMRRVTIYGNNAEDTGIYTHTESLGTACMIAACRATGYKE